MRVAILAPWFTSLAEIWAEELERLGDECLVVTTDGHFTAASRPGTVVLPAALKHRRAAPTLATAARALAAFRPQAAMVDETWDPRFQLLAAPLRRRLTVIHDARPHDDDLRRPNWQRTMLRRSRNSADHVLVFSHSVARQLRSDGLPAAAHVAPLTSEMHRALEAPIQGPQHRRDFLLAGRLGSYKGTSLVFEAWERYWRAGDREDRLIVLGQGHANDLPAGAVRRPGRYSWPDAADLFGRAKGVLCLYEAASQSGVQLLAMQCGSTPLVTDVGGLPEYQGLEWPQPIRHGDLSTVVGMLERLTDASFAAASGQRFQTRYGRHFDATVSARALRSALASLGDGSRAA